MGAVNCPAALFFRSLDLRCIVTAYWMHAVSSQDITTVVPDTIDEVNTIAEVRNELQERSR